VSFKKPWAAQVAAASATGVVESTPPSASHWDSGCGVRSHRGVLLLARAVMKKRKFGNEVRVAASAV
jgi:hypothetical protein